MSGGLSGATLQFFLQRLGKELFQGHPLISGKGSGLSNRGSRSSIIVFIKSHLFLEIDMVLVKIM